MINRFPDAKLVEEIYDLAENLDVTRFEALSHGIGLGRPKPIVKTSSPKAEVKVAAELAATVKPPPTPPTQKVVSAQPRVPAKPKKVSKRKNGPRKMGSPRSETPGFVVLVNRMSAHMIDLLVVMATTMVVLILLGILHDLKGFSLNPTILVQWLPVKLLAGLTLLELLVVVYASFFFYLAFFRKLVGNTLGNILLPLPNIKQAAKKRK